jgi:oligoendopeptidase F
MMLYNTTMMAHLEKKIYDAAEAGEAMNSDEICQAFTQLNEGYYGNSVKFVNADAYRWLSWAHYYINYYVYSYATSYAASTYLAENIINEGETGLNNFLSLLKAGNSDYPHEILKEAGVDLTSSEPIVAVAEKMNRLMDEMEEILMSQP